MDLLVLHEFHQANGAHFIGVNGRDAVAHYGNPDAEQIAFWESAVVSDLSYRSRLCVLGADRAKFLHGQVTNNVNTLRPGQGCRAALVSAKGKVQADLLVYTLENEILLEFEAGLTQMIHDRLEKYIIAEDAQIVDVAPHYGLWTVQGKKADDVLAALPWGKSAPKLANDVVQLTDSDLGEIYIANRSRGQLAGYDLYIPSETMAKFAAQIQNAAKATGAQFCGWQALETARIEAGLPRYGVDLDESNLAPEALGGDAISYSKGCYIGQEVIARIRTYGQVAKAFRGLRLPDSTEKLPGKGDKIFLGDKEVGYITSAAASIHFHANLALGYVRREANQAGAELIVRSGSQTAPAKIVELPFKI